MLIVIFLGKATVAIGAALGKLHSFKKEYVAFLNAYHIEFKIDYLFDWVNPE